MSLAPYQITAAMAPKMPKMIKDAKAALSLPPFIAYFTISSVLFLYRRDSKISFVKAFTFEIPCNVSSTIVFESAMCSCTVLE